MQRTTQISLGITLGLSILLHLALLPLVPAPTKPQPEDTIGPIAFETPSASSTPFPTPTPVMPSPTPRPTPTPHQLAPPHALRAVPHRHAISIAQRSGVARMAGQHVELRPANEGSSTGELARGGGAGPNLAAASPVPVSGEPSSPATTPPACAQPNIAAATLDAVAPDTPAIAQQQGISGDVTVLVSLDETSRVIGARVVTSPSALLNDAALRAARASIFRTEVRDCRAIAADYAFIVEFTSQ